MLWKYRQQEKVWPETMIPRLPWKKKKSPTWPKRKPIKITDAVSRYAVVSQAAEGLLLYLFFSMTVSAYRNSMPRYIRGQGKIRSMRYIERPMFRHIEKFDTIFNTGRLTLERLRRVSRSDCPRQSIFRYLSGDRRKKNTVPIRYIESSLRFDTSKVFFYKGYDIQHDLAKWSSRPRTVSKGSSSGLR